MKWKQSPTPLGRNYTETTKKSETLVNKNSVSTTSTNSIKNVSADEFDLFVSIIYGEANKCSEAAWRAVGHVIMNRIGKKEWTKLQTVTAVVTHKFAFEAYKGNQFNIADKYLHNDSKDKKPDKLIDKMVEVLKPVYNKTDTDNTSGAILYFSPKAQKALGREQPFWAKSDKLIQVKVDGLEATDDFKFYKYSTKPKPKTKPKNKKNAKTKKN